MDSEIFPLGLSNFRQGAWFHFDKGQSNLQPSLLTPSVSRWYVRFVAEVVCSQHSSSAMMCYRQHVISFWGIKDTGICSDFTYPKPPPPWRSYCLWHFWHFSVMSVSFSIVYTATQKHESTLLHTYVLNTYLTAYRSCKTKYFWKNSYRIW